LVIISLESETRGGNIYDQVTGPLPNLIGPGGKVSTKKVLLSSRNKIKNCLLHGEREGAGVHDPRSEEGKRHGQRKLRNVRGIGLGMLWGGDGGGT